MKTKTSLIMRNVAFGTLIVVSSVFLAYSFPDGAPVDTCVKPSRANEPNHGQARSQPVHTSPYAFAASSSQYGPGSQITGTFFKHFALTPFTFFSHILVSLCVRKQNQFKSDFNFPVCEENSIAMDDCCFEKMTVSKFHCERKRGAISSERRFPLKKVVAKSLEN